MAQELVYTALNPRGVQPAVSVTPPSPRLESLNGKVVYCVSQHVRGTDNFVKNWSSGCPNSLPG